MLLGTSKVKYSFDPDSVDEIYDTEREDLAG